MTKPDFPTQDQILDFIRENPDRSSRRDVARAFGIKGEERIKLKKLIRKMTVDGLLDKGHGAKFHLGGDLPPVTVVEISRIDQHGDLNARPTNWDGDGAPPKILLLSRDKRNSLAVGDRALVRLTPNKDKGESGYVAKVIRKLESKTNIVMGIFRAIDDKVARVEPTEKKNRNDYVIAKADWNGAEDGELVLIETKNAKRPSRNMTKARPAQVKECLGALDEPRSISLIALYAHNIPTDFPDDVLKEAEKSPAPVLKDVVDLRDIPLITVDPSDARDHDDAIWAEKCDEGWHVMIAIADVARYVHPTSALDREARHRGNSVYLPDRVVPMLPERLSNGLCSLKEGEDRYTMAVHIWFDDRGKKIRHKFVRGLMRSAGGLSYEEFQHARDGKPSEKAVPLIESVINPLYDAYEILLKGRNFRAPLELNVPERKVELDKVGNVVAIHPRISLPAHRLVEEFMIQANVAAAEELERKVWPCMYRVHDEPSPEKLETLRQFLASLDYSFSKGQVIQPKIFNNLLEKAEGTPHEEVINTIVLRSQSQAIYTPDNIGHFGLSLTKYAHFTSPIRRYADVLVHRALIGALKLGNDGLSAQDRENFQSTAEHISVTERTAMVAERECMDRYLAAYMGGQVGEVFEAKISGVNRAGIFATLHETGGDGFIPVSSIGGDYFIHDKDLHLLEGEYTGIIYQLGEKITVRLREANPVTGGLILELIDDELVKRAGRKKKRRPRKRKR